VVQTLGLEFRDLFPTSHPSTSASVVATYSYTDEAGALLFQVLRFAPKDFRVRRPYGNGGWLWNLHDTRRVLYRLPAILHADTVFLGEGEKDVERLWSLGVPATTNLGGAGKWRDEYTATLAGKHVVILPDTDEPGERHAHAVARALLSVAARVKIVRLPGVPLKGDVSDWLDAGHSKEEFDAMDAATPLLQADDVQGEPPPSSKKENPWDYVKTAPAFLAEEEKEFKGLAKIYSPQGRSRYSLRRVGWGKPRPRMRWRPRSLWVVSFVVSNSTRCAC
jgi:putative DNA primase/helicase